jgi:hypothetical protein
MKKLVWIFLVLTLVFLGSVSVNAQVAEDEANPAMAYDPATGYYLAVFDRYAFGITYQIWGQVLDRYGQPVNPSFVLFHGPNNYNPALAYDSQYGVFLVVWEHSTASGTDIYGKYVRVNSDGSVYYNGFQTDYDLTVNCDNGGVSLPPNPQKIEPAIAYDRASGNFMVVWIDNRNDIGTIFDTWDIYGQVVPPWDPFEGLPAPARCSGTPPQDITICNAIFDQYNPTIANDSVNGRFMVAWDDRRHISLIPAIKGRIFNSNGTTYSSEINITLPPVVGDPSRNQPAMGYDNVKQRFLVVWRERILLLPFTLYIIDGTLINSTGGFVGYSLSFGNLNDKQSPQVVHYSSPNPGDPERWIIAWQETDSGVDRIYYSEYQDTLTSLTLTGFTGSVPSGRAPSLAVNANYFDSVLAYEIPPSVPTDPSVIGYSHVLQDQDVDGVPDVSDNCKARENPVVAEWVDYLGHTHHNSQPDFDLDGFGDACDLCPEIANGDVNPVDGFADVCSPSHTDPPGWGTIVGASGSTVSVTFTYKGTDSYWIPPDCYNTVFVSNPPIPQNCRRRAPYVLAVEEEVDGSGVGIPSGDWVPVKDGDEWTITCNLLEIFDNNYIPPTPVPITPMYTSFSRERVDPLTGTCDGVCVDTTQYHLFNGTIIADTGSISLGQGGVSGSISVPIDIKPGSFPNTINLGSNGNVPVAILSTPYFDATQVAPETVTLADATVRVVGKKGTLQASTTDVNGDGLLDMLVHIDTKGLNLTPANGVVATLKGFTCDGLVQISGSDSVRVVP